MLKCLKYYLYFLTNINSVLLETIIYPVFIDAAGLENVNVMCCPTSVLEGPSVSSLEPTTATGKDLYAN